MSVKNNETVTEKPASAATPYAIRTGAGLTGTPSAQNVMTNNPASAIVKISAHRSGFRSTRLSFRKSK